MPTTVTGTPLLWRVVDVPGELCTTAQVDGETIRYAGDIRLGDLRGTGRADLLVYRSVDDAHDGGGMKPCFMGAFTLDGEAIWHVGAAGVQPSRPGPVAVYDIDGDGADEVICFFVDPTVRGARPDSLANVVVQIRDGSTGEVRREAAPPELRTCRGRGPNWVHQRLLVANFRGTARPQDFVVKLGTRLIALDDSLTVLWTYDTEWSGYSRCPAYIPAVGDIDGDGRDEVNGGYFLLDHDGKPLWEKMLGRHMDSVAIAPWGRGRSRAICSGSGHVMDERGNVILRLGEATVPHGQEVRVARFDPGDPEPQMIIRWNGHNTDVIVVNTQGQTVNRFRLNQSPNNTGMESVYWDGPETARLYNGGMLWHPVTGEGVALPGLPDPAPAERMAWYHCIPADVCGDEREELVLYNPWDTRVFIHTPAPLVPDAYRGYHPGPRQYNPRLMD